ncbi:hypothetical protein [Luteolibacter sp. AS25]|uniref:hypothetical protein n=1 Tax=Luteolibacter sp. AS25 TaxID=3135776 RepID=UPI00398AA60F
MSRASLEDCRDKLKSYMEHFNLHRFHKEEFDTYKAAFDEKVRGLESNQIPAKKTKESERQSRWTEIRGIFGAIDTEAAQAASVRLSEINERIVSINARIIEIMILLDGQAEPMEVGSLFSESQRLSSEAQTLKTEHAALTSLVNAYNAAVQEATPLNGEVERLTDEIDALKTEIDTIEGEAHQDKNHYEPHAEKVNHHRGAMDEINAKWQEYKCSEHGLELPTYEEANLTGGEEIPEAEDEEEDEVEIPELLDEPEEYEEGEEWDIREDDYSEDESEEEEIITDDEETTDEATEDKN